jgi:hypothetical protein
MPRLTLANEQMRIYDDFLPRDAFEVLLHHATRDQYTIIHKETWRKDQRLGDGLPLLGTTTYFRPDASLYEAEENPRYPTQAPIDAFIDGMKDVVGDAADVVGKAGSAWTGMTVAQWIYPVGSRLSLHRDRSNCAGSYTFFVHREWNFHWGGQLLIFDAKTTAETDPSHPTSYWPSDKDQNRPGMEPGLATCVLPKPNRLVFMATDVVSMITRVDVNAGNHPRVTLAGSFLRAKTV